MYKKRVIILNENQIKYIVRESVKGLIIDESQDHFASACSYIYCQNENNEWCILGAKRGSSAPSEGGKYNPPMGMKELWEDITSCAVRECEEETGLSLPPNKFKFINSEQWAHNRIGANFLVILDGCTLDYQTGFGDGENDRFEWVSIAEINPPNWAYQTGYVALEFFKKYID